MRVLVTGAAGFIGYHTAAALLARGDEVIGLDNLNDYYDVALKEARLALLTGRPGFIFERIDLADRGLIADLFTREKPERVVHLGAQAGVRYAAKNPHAYVDSNITGFVNMLEGCRHNPVEHLVFASTSSVYGANTRMPFRVEDNVDHPLSLYAATKKANELMAHTYAHLFGLPVTGLRFFTVYGPWGRPDMAPMIFARRILAGEPIDVFNHGQHGRDFTYIDDIVDGVVRALDRIAEPDRDWDSDAPKASSSSAPYRLYNIGSQRPVELMDFIACIEKATGKPAIKNFVGMQPGDVPRTYADVSDLIADTGFRPQTSIEDGVAKFVDWYRSHYG